MNHNKTSRIKDILSTDLPHINFDVTEKNGVYKINYQFDSEDRNNLVWGSFAVEPEKNIHLGTTYITNLPKQDLQGHGINKILMQKRLRLANDMNIDQMTAKLTQVSCYSHVKLGFLPSEDEWRNIKFYLDMDIDTLDGISENEETDLKEILKNTKSPEDIRKIADSPYGKELLIGKDNIMQSGWDTRLNLKDKATAKRFTDGIKMTNLEKLRMQEALNNAKRILNERER